jgi:molybdenum cofactor cytidylyltransferase
MLVAVVLAAGLSRRMGRRKLLLDVLGQPLVRWSVDAILPLVDEVLVVTGPDDVAVRDGLAGLRVRFATNPRPEDGQGTSIASGIAAAPPGADAALVVLGDQPWLPEAVVPALREAHRVTGKPIVVPVYRGTQGTPVFFARTIFPELATLTGDAGARPVVQRDATRVARVPLDIDMPLDVDTPDDLSRVIAFRTRRLQ